MATKKPHDAVFKSIFEQPIHAIALLQFTLPPDVSNTLDWSTLAHQPGALVGTVLEDHHCDLLFSVETHDGAARYLLIEHRSSPYADLPLRMHIYEGQIWHRFRKSERGPMPPIIPLLVSHVPGGWTSPVRLDAMLAVHPDNVELAAFTPNSTIIVEDLARRTNEELDAGLKTEISKLTSWLLRDARHADEFLKNLRYWVPHFTTALYEPDGESSLEPLVQYVALVCNRPLWDTFRATIHELAPETEEFIMTIAEEWIAQGREEGRAKGREEGRAHMLTEQLTLKFGELPAEIRARLASASAAELDVWARRVLFSPSLDDVFADAH